MRDDILVITPDHIRLKDYHHYIYEGLLDDFLMNYSPFFIGFINPNISTRIKVFHEFEYWKVRGIEASNILVQHGTENLHDVWFNRLRLLERKMYYVISEKEAVEIIKDILKKRGGYGGQ